MDSRWAAVPDGQRGVWDRDAERHGGIQARTLRRAQYSITYRNYHSRRKCVTNKTCTVRHARKLGALPDDEANEKAKCFVF